MDNQLTLTDDELSVIQGALNMCILTIEKYKEQNGTVDYATQQAVLEMKQLFNRFDKEYFN